MCTDLVFVCAGNVRVCVRVRACNIKPYLFRDGVCLANASWLPCSLGKQTGGRGPLYYFRTLQIVGTWKGFWNLPVFDLRRVSRLISILNDNTAEGRKNASPAAARGGGGFGGGALKWCRSRTMLWGVQALSASGFPNVCHVSAERREIKIELPQSPSLNHRRRWSAVI